MISRKVKQPRGGHFYLTPRHMQSAGFFLFAFLVLGYLSFRFVPFLFAPEIVVENPSSQNPILGFGEISIEGKTKNVNSLTLNGTELYIDKNGRFQKTVPLEDGVNTFSLEGRNVLGRTSKVAKHVIYIEN